MEDVVEGRKMELQALDRNARLIERPSDGPEALGAGRKTDAEIAGQVRDRLPVLEQGSLGGDRILRRRERDSESGNSDPGLEACRRPLGDDLAAVDDRPPPCTEW